MAGSGGAYKRAAAIDLFCGVGGLTHGLIRAGIPVVAGVDLDPACKYPFEKNNRSVFIHKDIVKLVAEDLASRYPRQTTKVLVGCAPCQPFSRYTRKQERSDDQKWCLLEHFSRLVEGVRPHVVSMENVPDLARHKVFHQFRSTLQAMGYKVGYSNVYCPDYGIPQHRKRLVLLASLLGELSLLPPTHSPDCYQTVKDAISDLPSIGNGETHPADMLHKACQLSEMNLERIRASKPGGCWRDWPDHLVSKCHKEDSGRNYVSVYGRMEWDQPAPTVTTQFFGYGNGRFGHPEQDRAISLREGSILQSFPRSYRFCSTPEEVSFSVLGRLIGNAVPVRLGEIIGQSIRLHLENNSG